MTGVGLLLTAPIVAAGCAGVFGLHDEPGVDDGSGAIGSDAGSGVDAGSGIGCHSDFMDTLRYNYVLGTQDFPTALDNCRDFDQRPVVFISDEEKAAVQGTGAAPYWLGVTPASDNTTFLGFSGCPLILPWATGQPMGGFGCVSLDTDNHYVVQACDTFSGAALCETPPQTDACFAQSMQRDFMAITKAVTHDDAVGMCQALGYHLIEIDSSAEIADALALASSDKLPSFWVAGEWNQSDWATSPTGCPMEFRWGASEPAIQGGHDQCVLYLVNNNEVMTDCAGTSPAICERN